MPPLSDPQAHAYLNALLSTPPDSVGAESNGGLEAGDELYLRIWELEQTNTNTRWTIATFFFSVSFAIFGFSFQANLTSPLPLTARLAALAIYWFAYALFRRFNAYTTLLRSYLRAMERERRTSLKVQTLVARQFRQGRGQYSSSTRLLLYFGLFYTCGVATLWWLAV